MTFDLFIPKVDRFISLPRWPAVTVCSKMNSFVIKCRVYEFGNTGTDWCKDCRTTRQRALCFQPVETGGGINMSAIIPVSRRLCCPVLNRRPIIVQYSHWQSLQTLICPATSNINLVVQFSRPPSQCTYIYWWYLFYMYRTLRQNYIRFGSHHIFVFPIQWYLEELRFWYHWTDHAWKQPHSPWRLSWHAYTYIRFRSRHLCTSGKKGTTDIGI